MTRIALLISLTLTLALSGCSTFGGGRGGGTGVDGSGTLSEQDLDAQREARFGEGGIPAAEGEGYFRDVRFEYDSSVISDAARQNIEYNHAVLQANPEVKVILEGHTDERGTAEYNLALGARRAKAVKDVLLSLGVPARKIETISYGEEVPLNPGHNEEAWVANRRVHFSAVRDEMYGR